MKKVIVVSGYFNPIHKGHIELFNRAKEYGDELWVIVNNDIQRELKGSKKFMKEDERLLIVSSLSVVDFSIVSINEDSTVSESLRYLNSKLL